MKKTKEIKFSKKNLVKFIIIKLLNMYYKYIFDSLFY